VSCNIPVNEIIIFAVIYRNKSMSDNNSVTYYVDETGDMTFFDKRGKPVNFMDGNVSKFFIIGVLKIKDDIADIEEKFNNLRQDLLQDPCLKGTPSLFKKTATAFHAKDDCAAVRREVFKLLKTVDVSVHAILIRKEQRLQDAKTLYQLKNKKTVFSEKDIYSELTKQIFKNLLHKSEKYDVIFSQRGKTFSSKSLTDALERAKVNFYNTHKIQVTSDVTPISSSPSKYIGLQIVDYYLWALKKLYEDGDISFFDILSDKFKIIMDIDDTRKKPYGEWYSISNKITTEKISGAN
jgi:hypothetical protein